MKTDSLIAVQPQTGWTPINVNFESSASLWRLQGSSSNYLVSLAQRTLLIFLAAITYFGEGVAKVISYPLNFVVQKIALPQTSQSKTLDIHARENQDDFKASKKGIDSGVMESSNTTPVLVKNPKESAQSEPLKEDDLPLKKLTESFDGPKDPPKNEPKKEELLPPKEPLASSDGSKASNPERELQASPKSELQKEELLPSKEPLASSDGSKASNLEREFKASPKSEPKKEEILLPKEPLASSGRPKASNPEREFKASPKSEPKKETDPFPNAAPSSLGSKLLGIAIFTLNLFFLFASLSKIRNLFEHKYEYNRSQNQDRTFKKPSDSKTNEPSSSGSSGKKRDPISVLSDPEFNPKDVRQAKNVFGSAGTPLPQCEKGFAARFSGSGCDEICGAVKKGYRNLMVKVHPDKNPSNPSATAAAQNLSEARKTLDRAYHC